MSRSTPTRTAVALVLAGLVAGCGAQRAESSAPDVATAAHTRTQLAPTDGTLLEPATGFGSRPPRWLGTRELPRTETGYAEVRPTPPALRKRRWTLPDTVPMLARRGFAAKVVTAFARIGWEWGGAWDSAKDYQHFSRNGR